MAKIDKEKIREAINFRSYYLAHVDGLKDLDGEQGLGICPFHGDTKNSFSVQFSTGLWNCKGCGAKGDIFTFHGQKKGLDFKETLKDLVKEYGLDDGSDEGIQTKKGEGAKKGRVKQTTPPSPDPASPNPNRKIIPMETVEELHQALLDKPDLLKKACAARCLTEETIRRHKIGWHDREKRLSIPIFDIDGECINIRLYNKSAEYKIKSWDKGYGSTSLYGIESLAEYPDPIVICEGEWDRLVLLQAGFSAVTHTNGADSFEKKWAPLFKDRDVIVCYDGDAGGYNGSRKTLSLLKPVAKSLKDVRLDDLGLVEGTPEDNDITDLARKGPEKLSELREAIAATLPLKIACAQDSGKSGASGNEFIAIFEADGIYWKTRKEAEIPISNFTLTPKRRVFVNESQEHLEAAVHFANQNGHGRPSRVTLAPGNWVSKSAFKKVMGELKASWKGNDDDLQDLKAYLSNLPCPIYTGEEKLGIHQKEEEWILVASDKTIAAKGEIDDLIHWTEVSTRTKYVIKDIEPASHKDIAEASRALSNFNAPEIMAGVTGWMMAVPFKARLANIIPILRSQFPILLMWGERGAGKTKTSEMIIQPFYADFETPRKVDELTRYTSMQAAHCTNLIPLALDEYKPGKMSPKQANEVSTLLRGCFNSSTGERGYFDSTGHGVKSYTYTAPVVLMGEQTLIEPALKERIIELTFSKESRKNAGDIQAFIHLNLAGVGLEYIRWTLGLADTEVKRIWQEEFRGIAEAFRDRPRENIATTRMGLRMWKRFLSEYQIAFDVDPLIEALEMSQKIAHGLEEGHRPKTDVDMIIEGMSTMAAMDKENIRVNQDFKISEGRLLLRLQTLYPRLKKWAKEFDWDGDLLDEHTLKRRLRDADYYDKRTSMNIIDGGQTKNVRVYALKIDELDGAGIDLDGFGIEILPF